MNRQCKQCNKEFNSERKSAVYCSSKCKMAFKRGVSVTKDIRVTDSVTQEKEKPVTLTKHEIVKELKKVDMNDPKAVKEGVSNLNQGIKPERDSGWRFTEAFYRNELITRIKNGEAEGSLEKHPQYGYLITRTPEQAKAYNEKHGYAVQGHWVKRQDDGTWLTKEQMLAKGIAA